MGLCNKAIMKSLNLDRHTQSLNLVFSNFSILSWYLVRTISVCTSNSLCSIIESIISCKSEIFIPFFTRELIFLLSLSLRACLESYLKMR